LQKGAWEHEKRDRVRRVILGGDGGKAMPESSSELRSGVTSSSRASSGGARITGGMAGLVRGSCRLRRSEPIRLSVPESRTPGWRAKPNG
jgi:hypothetical protein